jgi:hypothetical protein
MYTQYKFHPVRMLAVFAMPACDVTAAVACPQGQGKQQPMSRMAFKWNNAI